MGIPDGGRFQPFLPQSCADRSDRKPSSSQPEAVLGTNVIGMQTYQLYELQKYRSQVIVYVEIWPFYGICRIVWRFDRLLLVNIDGWLHWFE